MLPVSRPSETSTIEPPVRLALASSLLAVPTASYMCVPEWSVGIVASALLRVASSVVIGATTRAVWSNITIPTGCAGLRARMNARAAAIALSSATPFIESLVSITSTVPKCDCSIFEAGLTVRPWTGTPPSVTEIWRRVSTPLDGTLSRNARCGKWAPPAWLRLTPDAHACDAARQPSNTASPTSVDKRLI